MEQQPHYTFPGGDEEILSEVHNHVDEVVIEDGLDEDGDSLDEHDGPEAPSISVREAMAICKQMDMVCSGFPKAAHDGVSTLELHVGDIRLWRWRLQGSVIPNCRIREYYSTMSKLVWRYNCRVSRELLTSVSS